MILQNQILQKPYVIKLIQMFEKYNIAQVLRYGIVGIAAASTHIFVAMVAFHVATFAPTPSNFAGFVSGALISYFGSYYFTFKNTHGHQGGHVRTLPRFALVWLMGIAINVGLFKAFMAVFAIPFALNVFIAVALTPIAQFLMLKFWAFKK